MNNMDHMRIIGTKSSSVIFCQTESFQKFEMMSPECQNKLKPKGIV